MQVVSPLRQKKVGLGLALLVLRLSAVLGATVLREPIAYAASPFQNVVIVNTDDKPVPVKSSPPPLWQGTPYLSTNVIFGPGCEPANVEVPAGKVLYVQHATASFNVAPGRSASPAVGMTPLGGSANFVYIPSHASGPVHQSFGVYDGYQGSNDVGLPTSATPQACLFAVAADDVRGRIIITGYLVDAS